MKRVMPFVQATREKVEQLGVKALALTLEFDEAEVLRNNSAYLANTLDVSFNLSMDVKRHQSVSCTGIRDFEIKK